jgi:hypothetical protein
MRIRRGLGEWITHSYSFLLQPVSYVIKWGTYLGNVPKINMVYILREVIVENVEVKTIYSSIVP